MMNSPVMTLARFTAKPLREDEVQLLVNNVLEDLSGMQGLLTMILFGSALTAEMSEASDIDIVMIFDTAERAKISGSQVHGLRKKSLWPMDILCVDRETFLQKCKVGGIYFVAYHEGKVIFGTMP